MQDSDDERADPSAVSPTSSVVEALALNDERWCCCCEGEAGTGTAAGRRPVLQCSDELIEKQKHTDREGGHVQYVSPAAHDSRRQATLPQWVLARHAHPRGKRVEGRPWEELSRDCLEKKSSSAAMGQTNAAGRGTTAAFGQQCSLGPSTLALIARREAAPPGPPTISAIQSGTRISPETQYQHLEYALHNFWQHLEQHNIATAPVKKKCANAVQAFQGIRIGAIRICAMPRPRSGAAKFRAHVGIAALASPSRPRSLRISLASRGRRRLEEPDPKRKRGRPANASKLPNALPENEAVVQDDAHPRKRGRPRKSLDDAAQEDAPVKEKPRKRGRPSLADNEKTSAAAEDEPAMPKRKRGRPSLDKQRVEDETVEEPGRITRKKDNAPELPQREAQAEAQSDETRLTSKRGRKPAQADMQTQDDNEQLEDPRQQKRRRGRPAQAEQQEKPIEIQPEEPPPRRKGGRKLVADTTSPAAEPTQAALEPPPRRRGRPSLQEIVPDDAQNKNPKPPKCQQ
ncbi:hypothetical protein G7046_g9904 [Stylonectria norvegica]|nr:hypothetical protein G7046_g9904 [Stylonectria norvegica]